MSRTLIQNGDSGLDVRTAINSMFGEIYDFPSTPQMFSDGVTIGDGDNDDTEILQSWLDSIQGGGTLFLPRPSVKYKITDGLIFPSRDLYGEKFRKIVVEAGTIIEQQTDNTPIFSMTVPATYFQIVGGLVARWASNQTLAANPNSSVLLIRRTINGSANVGVNNFVCSDWRVEDAAHAIACDSDLVGTIDETAFWGYNIERIHTYSCSGEVFRLTEPGAGGGSVRGRIADCNLWGYTAETQAIYVSQTSGLVLENIEYLRFPALGPLLTLNACDGAEVVRNRFEDCDIEVASRGLIEIIGTGGTTIIRAPELNNSVIKLGTGETSSFIRVSGQDSTVSVLGMTVDDVTDDATNLGTLRLLNVTQTRSEIDYDGPFRFVGSSGSIVTAPERPTGIIRPVSFETFRFNLVTSSSATEFIPETFTIPFKKAWVCGIYATVDKIIEDGSANPLTWIIQPSKNGSSAGQGDSLSMNNRLTDRKTVGAFKNDDASAHGLTQGDTIGVQVAKSGTLGNAPIDIYVEIVIGYVSGYDDGS
jgi:hypothetical protein